MSTPETSIMSPGEQATALIRIKVTKHTMAEFRACETGANEDGVRGPSPLTTLEILERADGEIVIKTPEEAAQIADCCAFGTFPLYCQRSAQRIREDALTVGGALEILRKWERSEMEGLLQRIIEAQR